MVPQLLGSTWLTESRQRLVFSLNQWQTSLSSLHVLLNALYPTIPRPNTPKHPKSGWVGVAETNNEEAEREWGWRKRGLSSDPHKTLSNKTGTLRAWQWLWPALFFATPLVGQDKGIPQYDKKAKESQGVAFEIFKTSNPPPPHTLGLVCFKGWLEENNTLLDKFVPLLPLLICAPCRWRGDWAKGLDNTRLFKVLKRQ